MSEHQHERPAALDVIREALAVAVPDDNIDRRAEVVLATLQHYGHLPEDGGDKMTPEEMAQWLAERSGFARYTLVENGWRAILASEPDVHTAAAYALERVPGSEVDAVRACKAALLHWHQHKA